MLVLGIFMSNLQSVILNSNRSMLALALKSTVATKDDLMFAIECGKLDKIVTLVRGGAEVDGSVLAELRRRDMHISAQALALIIKSSKMKFKDKYNGVSIQDLITPTLLRYKFVEIVKVVHEQEPDGCDLLFAVKGYQPIIALATMKAGAEVSGDALKEAITRYYFTPHRYVVAEMFKRGVTLDSLCAPKYALNGGKVWTSSSTGFTFDPREPVRNVIFRELAINSKTRFKKKDIKHKELHQIDRFCELCAI